jgi:hypothetical protein
MDRGVGLEMGKRGRVGLGAGIESGFEGGGWCGGGRRCVELEVEDWLNERRYTRC